MCEVTFSIHLFLLNRATNMARSDAKKDRACRSGRWMVIITHWLRGTKNGLNATSYTRNTTRKKLRRGARDLVLQTFSFSLNSSRHSCLVMIAQPAVFHHRLFQRRLSEFAGVSANRAYPPLVSRPTCGIMHISNPTTRCCVMPNCVNCGTWNPEDKNVCWRCQTELPKPVIRKSGPLRVLRLACLALAGYGLFPGHDDCLTAIWQSRWGIRRFHWLDPSPSPNVVLSSAPGSAETSRPEQLLAAGACLWPSPDVSCACFL